MVIMAGGILGMARAVGGVEIRKRLTTWTAFSPARTKEGVFLYQLVC